VKYILLMNTMRAGESIPSWPKSDLQNHIAFMINIDKELRASGELVFEEGLSFPDQAKLVRAGDNGTPITDDVFPQNKEFLTGFWIVDVKTPDRAYEIAARISAAPGPGGAPLNFPLEVRPIPGGPPPEML